jgi:Domain of unknown function (DUF5076)
MNDDARRLNQQQIPEAAIRDVNSIEMARIWIAERQLHASLRIGFYKENTKFSEEKAWGTILADLARHVANALEENYSTSSAEALKSIVEAQLQELKVPTSKVSGKFELKN